MVGGSGGVSGDIHSSKAVPKKILLASGAQTMPKLKSVIVGPSAPKDPLVTVIPSLLKEQVLNFISAYPSPTPFRVISLLDIDHGTLILDYFNDSHLLIHLAFSLYPQFGDHALKKLALDYLDTDVEEDADMDTDEEMGTEEEKDPSTMQYEEDSDADIEVLEEPPTVFRTPSKKKAFKVKEHLDDSFLRHSRRLSSKAKGYKDAKSTQKAKKADEGDTA